MTEEGELERLARRNAELEAEVARLREREPLLQSIDLMLEGLQIVDRNFRYRYLNATAAKHGRCEPSDLIGRNMEECFPGIERTPLFAVLRRALARGQREWLQNQFTYPDGSDGWFELVVSPVPEGLLILSVDITERKRLELRNGELETFSYTVAHDLRAPLRAIEGFAEILEEDHGAALGVEGGHYLRRIRAATTRMGQLIDDLLSLARVNRAEMHRREVDLSRVAAAACSRQRSRDPERHVECVIEPGLQVNADPGLLEILLENLIGNAFKFTAKRPTARIEIGRDDASYYVRDNGAGFDMAHEGKLFGVFQRLHPQDEFAGTGIGLATVQRIAVRHGGKVWAEGQVDRGATFHFTLHA